MSSPHPIYRLTSIGRPLDPAYPSNKAVVVLMPVGAAAALGLALLRGAGGMELVFAGVQGLLSVFLSWALARELSPDDPSSGFLSVAAALGVLCFLEPGRLLLPAVALFVVRIVNRSTGLAARPLDSGAVLLLVGAAVVWLEMPLLAFVAAAAFVADAGMRGGLRRHWILALLALALGAAGLAVFPPDALTHNQDPGFLRVACAAVALAWLTVALRTRQVESVGDIGDQVLDVARVRAGMLIGLATALAALPAGTKGLSGALLLWATILGVTLGQVAWGRVAARRGIDRSRAAGDPQRPM